MSDFSLERSLAPVETPSVLGAVLGFEFECSFSAAEANKAVYKLFEEIPDVPESLRPSHPNYEQVQVLHANLSPQYTKHIGLGGKRLTAEQPVRLALVELVQRTPQPTPKQGAFRTLFRKHVQTEYEEEGHPTLVAKFDDVALPLATFARRKDGLCSYVQIGSEITDDSLHVLSTDDATGRHTIIEAIRGVVDKKYADHYASVDTNAITTRQYALQRLLDTEFEQNKDKLAEAFEAQLVRKCAAEIDSNTEQELTVVNDTGDAYDQKYTIKKLFDRTLLDDNRVVSLVGGRPVEGFDTDSLQLFAVTRGILALPLAQLDPSMGQLTFENTTLNSDPQQRKEAVYQLLSILREEPLVKHKHKHLDHLLGDLRTRERNRDYSHYDYTRSEETRPIVVSASGDNVDPIILNYFDKHRGDDYHPFFRDELPVTHLNDPDDIGDEVRERVEKFMENPLVSPNPYPDSQVLSKAVSRLLEENAVHAAILRQLDAPERLASVIGDTSVEQENLVQTLYDMQLNSTVHRGIIENVAINNTLAHVILEANVEREGSCYTVTVSGKPEAMTDEPLKLLPFFCFSFDATIPIHEQLNGTKDHIGELLTIFSSLSPVK